MDTFWTLLDSSWTNLVGFCPIPGPPPCPLSRSLYLSLVPGYVPGPYGPSRVRGCVRVGGNSDISDKWYISDITDISHNLDIPDKWDIPDITDKTDIGDMWCETDICHICHIAHLWGKSDISHICHIRHKSDKPDILTYPHFVHRLWKTL